MLLKPSRADTAAARVLDTKESSSTSRTKVQMNGIHYLHAFTEYSQHHASDYDTILGANRHSFYNCSFSKSNLTSSDPGPAACTARFDLKLTNKKPHEHRRLLFRDFPTSNTRPATYVLHRDSSKSINDNFFKPAVRSYIGPTHNVRHPGHFGSLRPSLLIASMRNKCGERKAVGSPGASKATGTPFHFIHSKQHRVSRLRFTTGELQEIQRQLSIASDPSHIWPTNYV